MAVQALVLIAHGSPDPDWRKPIDAVVERARSLVRGTSVAVVAAFLEHDRPDLSEAMKTLRGQGIRQIQVLPLLLSSGGNHVKRDLPALVAEIAVQNLDLDIRLIPGTPGDDPRVIDALARHVVGQLI